MSSMALSQAVHAYAGNTLPDSSKNHANWVPDASYSHLLLGIRLLILHLRVYEVVYVRLLLRVFDGKAVRASAY